ncbi:hypothetical protein SAMN04515674_1063 [Pseudarcicella hirudinis]|uniref:HEAT repeat-containing protein n=1 Tax=Pseudarcicella hirudinis TaxID=1079859 RepID=A0A1I5TEY5_9BACT|nr:hypothetical protein [Pseudarcicella hirudinis]SFP81247.1 hypothetical protein SAMN04515674_1063 [Pseudarcicella hirudinis]
MSIISLLASSLGRKDEIPNQELAKQIVSKNDKDAIKELVENLNNKNKNIQNDCIKVIYEIGTLKPLLIADFTNQLIALLDHKNNRLQWGAMTALDILTNEKPGEIFSALPGIIAAADRGSVITNDHCVGILIKFCAMANYAEDVFPLLIERLVICPTNQLPMYAENALPIINQKNKSVFIRTLTERLSEIEKETKRSRVEKVIKKADKLL